MGMANSLALVVSDSSLKSIPLTCITVGQYFATFNGNL